jgi:hypothetical protein
MVNRRNWVVVLVVAILALSLSGCMAAAVAVPDRPLTIDVDTALAAQNKAMMGQLSWTESEFSSLLSVLLDQNTSDNNPVTGISVWFEPDNQVIVRVGLKDGVIPVGNTLDLAGTIGVVDGYLNIDLSAAGVGNMSISGAMLAPISAQINSALSGPGMMMLPVNVHTDTGMLSVGM